MIATLTLAALAASPLTAPRQQDAASAGTTFAVRAAHMDLGDGRRVEDGVLLVEAGKVRAAGRGVEVPAGVPVIEHDGFVTAGIVGCGTATGLAREGSDATRSVLARARVADAFDAWHPELRDALESGVTTLLLAPGRDVLAGGSSAAVKTAGGGVLSERAHLALALCDEALRPNRHPTSSSGAFVELDRQLRSGQEPFDLAVSGRLPVLIAVTDRGDVQRAIELAGRHELRGALIGAPLSGEIAADVKRSGLAAIVGPFPVGTPRRHLRAVAALAEAGVPLAFAVEAPARHPGALRLSAALCVREGLDPATAWKALTSDAARIAGVGERVGRLERGLDADFVLWSGDPLDLTSAVQAVYVDGELVHPGGDR